MAPSLMETESAPQDPSALKAIDPTNTAKVRNVHEEYQYLDLIQQILDTGEHRPDR